MGERRLPKRRTTRRRTERQEFNLVADTVGGPNVRLRDNLFQAVAILVSVSLGALIGCLVATDRAIGALAGAGIGLLLGLFGSGLFLMIYRAVKHSRGEHD